MEVNRPINDWFFVTQESTDMPREYKPVGIVVALTLLGASAAPPILTQEKPAESNIKVQTLNVVVDVIVTDRHGKHAPGLTAEDFTVYEDGVPQKIIGFTAAAALEFSPPAATAGTSGAPKPDAPGKAPLMAQPRLLTVVLDLADNRPSNTKSS